MNKYLLLLTLLFSNILHADCSSCAEYLEAVVISKLGERHVGWIEIGPYTKDELKPEELLNYGLGKAYYESYNGNIIIHKNLTEIRHPELYKYGKNPEKKLLVNTFEFPYFIVAKIEDILEFKSIDVEKIIINGNKKFKLHPNTNAYYVGSLKYVNSYMLNKIINQPPHLTMRWDERYVSHYIYSYNHNISTLEEGFKILSPLLGNEYKNFDFNNFRKNPVPFINESLIYLPIYHESL